MKPFKFFTGHVEKHVQYNQTNIYNPTQRRYMGIERGIINWIGQPTGMVYYMEPRMSIDPINEDGIPQISMDLRSHTVTTETYTYLSFEQFVDINAEKYIFIYQVLEVVNGTIHTSENTIPLGVPLIIRAAILD